MAAGKFFRISGLETRTHVRPARAQQPPGGERRKMELGSNLFATRRWYATEHTASRSGEPHWLPHRTGRHLQSKQSSHFLTKNTTCSGVWITSIFSDGCMKCVRRMTCSLACYDSGAGGLYQTRELLQQQHLPSFPRIQTYTRKSLHDAAFRHSADPDTVIMCTIHDVHALMHCGRPPLRVSVLSVSF